MGIIWNALKVMIGSVLFSTLLHAEYYPGINYQNTNPYSGLNNYNGMGPFGNYNYPGNSLYNPGFRTPEEMYLFRLLANAQTPLYKSRYNQEAFNKTLEQYTKSINASLESFSKSISSGQQALSTSMQTLSNYSLGDASLVYFPSINVPTKDPLEGLSEQLRDMSDGMAKSIKWSVFPSMTNQKTSGPAKKQVITASSPEVIFSRHSLNSAFGSLVRRIQSNSQNQDLAHRKMENHSTIDIYP